MEMVRDLPRAQTKDILLFLLDCFRFPFLLIVNDLRKVPRNFVARLDHEHVIKSGHEIAWDRAHAEVIDYSMSRNGVQGKSKSRYIKSERADCQLMSRDGGLAVSAIWQQAL